MQRIVGPRVPVVLSFLFSLWLLPGTSFAIEDPHARYAPPLPRAGDVISPAAAARLSGGSTVAMWVYFADKEETDARQFARAVAQAGDRVTPAARARRARETGGKFVPDYYDVPVATRYIDGVRSTGATIRHASRWLNAVSVEADEATAHRIASLPYVSSITVLRTSKRVEPIGAIVPIETSTTSTPIPTRELTAGALSSSMQEMNASLGPPAGFGSSIGQLTGINAKAAQDSGYTGAGVMVAMFDTGFNKAHNATVNLKRIAEFDFVFHDSETANQGNDVPSAWDHGTGTWSVLGGYYDGSLIGPAYNASFLLAKTEDVRSETPIEEDNWLAAVQWADSIGADVISSSLAYMVFDDISLNHTYSQLDGKTTTVTKAAALAARRGIVVSNAMANSGPDPATIQAPADADSILSVGAVDASNVIAGFSSRGPTFDGRGKPEVVAQGVNTTWAVASSNSFVAATSGTSLSTPLIGGAAALVREAHPEWTVQQVRFALKKSGDKAASPDSTTYGWGRPDVVKAIYGTTLGGPIYPKPFNLVAPTNNSAVTTTPVLFRWRRSVDPNGDPVTYHLILTRTSPDSVVYDIPTTDTTYSFPGYLGPSKTYRWTVTARDPGNHVRPSRDQFQFQTGASTDVTVAETAPGVRVALYPNRPNPVSSSTLIPFAIANGSATGMVDVTLRIFDANGRLVRTLLNGICEGYPATSFSKWDGKDQNGRRVSSGIYYYRLTAAGQEYTRRMAVLR